MVLDNFLSMVKVRQKEYVIVIPRHGTGEGLVTTSSKNIQIWLQQHAFSTLEDSLLESMRVGNIAPITT